VKALILMSRVPKPGKTKTRLMEIFSGEQCANIHKAFLLDLFNVFSAIKEEIDIYLTYTPEEHFHMMEDMIPSFIKCFPQRGETLGIKMANAIQEVLDKGYDEVVLMGSDIPSMQPREIIESFELLKDNDICIGPTLDGGYYLIGMKRLYKQLFTGDLKWGHKSVLECTLGISNKLGLKVGLAKKHRDIDTKEDLVAFIEEIEANSFSNKLLPINTIDFINNNWGAEDNAKGRLKG
jgi:hypothetical protein